MFTLNLPTVNDNKAHYVFVDIKIISTSADIFINGNGHPVIMTAEYYGNYDGPTTSPFLRPNYINSFVYFFNGVYWMLAEFHQFSV